MEKIDQAAQHAEELIEATRTRPERLLDSSSTTNLTKWKTIYERLMDLYLEENKKETTCSKLTCTSHLLDKLIHRDHLNTLVVNLYPENQGYSLMLKGRSGGDAETMRLPYEESELLDYIDSEQLPPLLVDLLDKVQANIFYCGAVIAEIRDFRRTVNNTHDTCFVLLKPTAQTLLCDINAMTSSSHRWMQEDKLALESQLLLRVNEPLCLDPSAAVCIVANRLNYQKHKLNHQALKRAVKKYSQTAINKKRKIAQCPAPKHLKLHDFLNHKKEKTKQSPPVNLKVGKTCVDMWRQQDVHLTTPDSIEVEKYAKALEKPKIINDNTPMVVEEYTFETERSLGKVYYSKLTIMQRLNEEFYLGQLYVDRDYIEGKSQGSTCKFPLGIKANVEKYIRQFREIFTEEGRRQVKITHQVPGQHPKVSFTQTLHAVAASQTPVSTQQTNIITQATNLAATLTGQLGLAASCSDSTGSKTTPIRLSLSLNPSLAVCGSSTSTTPSGTPVTAQLTLNLPQQQQLAAAHRVKQMNIYQNLQRSSNASTPTTPGQAPQMPSTPKSQLDTAGLLVASTTNNQGLLSVTSSASRHPVTISAGMMSTSLSQTSGATPPPNVNIANISSAPPNINIQNIAGLKGVNLAANLQGLQGIQNVQTSLTSPSIVTMVTATPVSGKMSSTAAVVSLSSAGLISTPSTIISSPSTGMLSLPIGVAGNITQFMAGLKGAQGLRPGTPLLLSQIPGQPGQQVQLLSATSLSQTRGQEVTITSQSGSLASKAGISAPATNTTAVLTPQNLVAQPMSLTAIPQLRNTAGQPQMFTAQHLVQLTSQQPLAQLALHQQKLQGQPQQKLTLQQLQQQKSTPQQLQQPLIQQKFTQQQIKQLQQQVQQGASIPPASGSSSSGSKSKNKKKSGTPPKS